MNEILLEIAQEIKKGNVIFFIGAGVSKNAPSNIPLSVEFNQAIVKKISEGLSVSIGKNDINRLSKIRLESFFSQLNSLLKGDVYQIVNSIKDTSPNHIHYFISQLYRKGYLKKVLTTNFDCLVEKATQSDYLVFHHPDDYKYPVNNRSLLKIFKLHGSIDVDITKMKSSIQISLQDVSKPIYSKKLDLLEKTIKSSHIVFIGYSGLDDFDIFPILLRTKSAYKYYWINHTENNSDRFINDNVKKIANRKTCHLLNINTTTFINILAKSLDIQLPKTSNNNNNNVIKRIKKNVKQSVLYSSPNYIIGKLFSFIRDKDNCLKYYNYAIDKKELNDDYILRDMGAAYMRANEFNIAIKIYRSCLTRAKEPSIIAANKLNIGYAYLEKYNKIKKQKQFLVLSETYLKSALNTPGIDKRNLSYCLHNLSLLYVEKKDFDTALKLLEKSILIKSRIGDINAKGRGFAVKGQIFSLISQNKKALYYFDKSLKIQKQVQDKTAIIATLLNKADHFTRTGNKNKALQCQRLAMQYSSI